MVLDRKSPSPPLRRLPLAQLLCAAPLALLACGALAQTAAECAAQEDKYRLACYDRLFPPVPAGPTGEPELTVPPLPDPKVEEIAHISSA